MITCKKYFLLILVLIFCNACGGGDGSSLSPNPQPPEEPPEKKWKSMQLNSIDYAKTHIPNVRTVLDNNDNFHISYFAKEDTKPDTPDQIPEIITVEGNNYANTQNKVGENCSIVLDQNGYPIIFYQAELPDNKKRLRVAIIPI